MNDAAREPAAGMTLAELIVSLGVFSLVAAGAIGSASMLAKMAAEHENQADFRRDIRSGLAQLAQDARNAASVENRTETSFNLTYPNGPDVAYALDSASGELRRNSDGRTRVVFNRVATFDVLKDAADAQGNDDLLFSEDELAIESLRLSASDGTGQGSSAGLDDFTVALRNP